MDWNVWVIKPYGINNRQLSNGSQVWEGNISPKFFAVVPNFLFENLHFPPAVALQFSSMQREVSRVKRASLLSQNGNGFGQRQQKYYASEDKEDEDEPRPPSRRSATQHPLSPEIFASSSVDEIDVGKYDTTWKLFFHLLDLVIVKSYIILSSGGGKNISHRNFRITLIRKMLTRSGHEPRKSMPVGRPATASTNIGGLVTRHNKHWPDRSITKRRCRLCSATGVTRTVMFKRVNCDVMLCVDGNCLADYHTKGSYKTSFLPSSLQTDEASTTIQLKKWIFHGFQKPIFCITQ